MRHSLLVFAGVAAVLTVAPGPDSLLTLNTGVRAGVRAALATASGVVSGVLVWGLASATGLSALLVASRPAFDALRMVGAAYLAFLAIKAFREARRLGRPRSAAAEPGGRRPGDHPAAGAFRKGLLTNLLNPKVGAFYVALLPQFLPAHGDVLVTAIGLASVHAAEGMLWLFLVAVAAHRLGGKLRHPAVRRRMEQASGVVFLGFAVRLAAAR